MPPVPSGRDAAPVTGEGNEDDEEDADDDDEEEEEEEDAEDEDAGAASGSSGGGGNGPCAVSPDRPDGRRPIALIGSAAAAPGPVQTRGNRHGGGNSGKITKNTQRDAGKMGDSMPLANAAEIEREGDRQGGRDEENDR